MLIRILYRLALQRVAASTPRIAGAPTAGGTPRRSSAGPLLLAAALLLGFTAALFLRESQMATSDQASVAHTGALRLVIDDLQEAPLVVYLSGGSLPPMEPPAGHAPPRVTSRGAVFVPDFQVVPPGSVLEVANDDPYLHNTHLFRRGETVFNVAAPHPGMTVRKPLVTTGLHEARCDLHPWMRATLLVPPSPHYALLHKAGTVDFAALAPGRYLLHLWQPGMSEQWRTVEISQGETTRLRLR